MADITINGISYPLVFGMKWLRETNAKVKEPIPGMKDATFNVGVNLAITQVLSGSVEYLADVIYTANKGQNPQLTMSAIDAFLENEETDIDAVFESVKDFLSKANVTKKVYHQTAKNMESLEEQTI